MHPTELPQYALDGALRRRGKIHAIEHVDPAKCALVVIDMQNVFLQKGAPAETPIAREIVPNVNKLADAVRQTGGKVIWVQMTHGPENLNTWSFFYEVVSRPKRAQKMLEWMAPGVSGATTLAADGCARRGLVYREDQVQRIRTRLIEYLGSHEGTWVGYRPDHRHSIECLL